MEKLLTPPEAWAYLQIGRTSLYRLVKQGKLPVIRVGKLLRFRKEDLDALSTKADAPSPTAADRS